MRESWGLTKPKGAMKVKARLSVSSGGIPAPTGGAHHRPVSSATSVRRSKSVHVGTRKMVNYA